MAGATALIARLAPPANPMAWARRAGGASSDAKEIPALNIRAQLTPCAARSTTADKPGPWMREKPSEVPAIANDAQAVDTAQAA